MRNLQLNQIVAVLTRTGKRDHIALVMRRIIKTILELIVFKNLLLTYEVPQPKLHPIWSSYWQQTISVDPRLEWVAEH